MDSASLRLLVLLILIPAAAFGQNCKKGIPCGHSCISASKVCRIGAPAPETPAAGAVEPRGLVSSPSSPPASSAGEGYAFIGSFADGIYFSVSCLAAQDLAPPNRRYFATAAVAEAAGYRRSRVSGC